MGGQIKTVLRSRGADNEVQQTAHAVTPPPSGASQSLAVCVNSKFSVSESSPEFRSCVRVEVAVLGFPS